MRITDMENDDRGYNRSNYPIFICRHGNWDIFANANGACASIPTGFPESKGCKASAFGTVQYVQQTLKVDAPGILARALAGRFESPREHHERTLLVLAIKAVAREADEAGGCDHAVGICVCGTESFLDDAMFAAIYGDDAARIKFAKQLVEELQRDIDAYEVEDRRHSELSELIASLQFVGKSDAIASTGA